MILREGAVNGMKRIFAVFLMLTVLAFCCQPVAAQSGAGKAYTYDHNKTAMATPDPYSVQQVLYGNTHSFSNPKDICYQDGYIFILNGGENGKITVLNRDLTFSHHITFTKEGKPYTVKEAVGFWVDADGTILVCDRSGKKVFRTDKTGAVLQEYGRPNTELMGENTDYLPYRVLTDRLGQVYILCEGQYRGVLQLKRDGTFVSFYGAKTVAVTATLLLDMLWRNFMTDKMIANSSRSLPTEYSNMAVDGDGFIYLTSAAGSSKDYLVKLNSAGKNVMPGSDFGDYNLGKLMGTPYRTHFTSLTVDEQGYISVVDETWNRIFQYSPEGELLYVFGGTGQQEGTFGAIGHILAIDETLLVTDSSYNSITVFSLTEFGRNVRSANQLFEAGLFEESIQPWQEVLTECSNYELAYVGIGKAYQVNRQYEEAMHYFKLGYSRPNYSKAYQRHRSQVMRDYFPPVMTAVVIVIAVLIAVRSFVRKKYGVRKLVLDESGKGAYLFYLLFHPADGFFELRHNRKYSLWIANLLAFLWFLLEALTFNYNGFIFNYNNAADFSVISIFITTVGLCFMFCLSNWLLATFFNGKGRFKEVWIYFCYALVPMLFSSAINLLLSQFLTKDESMFMEYIGVIGTVWTVILVVVALQQLHQYAFVQNLFSLFASVVGVMILLFIGLLAVNLYTQCESFLSSVFKEILYRVEVGF